LESQIVLNGYIKNLNTNVLSIIIEYLLWWTQRGHTPPNEITRGEKGMQNIYKL
jgi:hypothetical protein